MRYVQMGSTHWHPQVMNLMEKSNCLPTRPQVLDEGELKRECIRALSIRNDFEFGIRGLLHHLAQSVVTILQITHKTAISAPFIWSCLCSALGCISLPVLVVTSILPTL